MLSVKRVTCVLILGLALLSTGCAMVSAPVNGVIWSHVHGPLTATGETVENFEKEGTASCYSILGLFALGDASIETAAMTANITKITHVDYESASFFGIFARYTVHVHGE